MRAVSTAPFSTAPLGVARVFRVAALTQAGELVWVVYTVSRGVAAALTQLATAVLRLRQAWPSAAEIAAGPLAAAGLVRQSRSADAASAAASRLRETTLPADPTAPRQARALLRSAAEEWDLDDDLHQDGAMVVTELVANAVDHARTPSTLTLSLDARGLRIAVRDGCRGPAPRPRPVDPTAPRGRGLQMIDALAASWGVAGDVDGKTVWAVLPRP